MSPLIMDLQGCCVALIDKSLYIGWSSRLEFYHTERKHNGTEPILDVSYGWLRLAFNQEIDQRPSWQNEYEKTVEFVTCMKVVL